MPKAFTESVVELAADWQDYRQVGLEQRPRGTLVRLNPQFRAEALEDAFRKLTCPKWPMLEACKRAVHQGVFST